MHETESISLFLDTPANLIHTLLPVYGCVPRLSFILFAISIRSSDLVSVQSFYMPAGHVVRVCLEIRTLFKKGVVELQIQMVCGFPSTN